MNIGAPKLTAYQQSWRYEVYACELREFLESGGAARCLVCRLS